ncbi:MAG: RNA polymerase sigma factor [Pyrinomonadaceae bacterium]
MKEDIVPAVAIATPAAVPRDSNFDPARDLESLFRAHHQQIFRTAYRVTGSATDAEDVLQTIFLRLVRREEQAELAMNPGRYFHRAAVNAALDVVRGRSRAKLVSLDDDRAVAETDYLESAHSAGPEALRAGQELRRVVQQSVARLGGRSAEMFALRYFEGYDNREIARMLDTSQMVVAVMLHRARARVRKEVGEFLEIHHEEA